MVVNMAAPFPSIIFCIIFLPEASMMEISIFPDAAGICNVKTFVTGLGKTFNALASLKFTAITLL